MTGEPSNQRTALAQAERGRGHELGHAGGQRGGQHGRSIRTRQAHRGSALSANGSLMTRLAAAFSVADGVAECLRSRPAAFTSASRAWGDSTSSGLAGPQSAVLSAVIFNALIVVHPDPSALRGVDRALGAGQAPAEPLQSTGSGCSSPRFLASRSST